MSAPPEWKSDGFFVLIKVRDMATGDWSWRRAEQGEFSVILDAAVAAEREACANIAEDRANDGEIGTWQAQEGLIIAADIRARNSVR